MPTSSPTAQMGVARTGGWWRPRWDSDWHGLHRVFSGAHRGFRTDSGVVRRRWMPPHSLIWVSQWVGNKTGLGWEGSQPRDPDHHVASALRETRVFISKKLRRREGWSPGICGACCFPGGWSGRRARSCWPASRSGLDYTAGLAQSSESPPPPAPAWRAGPERSWRPGLFPEEQQEQSGPPEQAA